jgi:hypothetical protein
VYAPTLGQGDDSSCGSRPISALAAVQLQRVKAALPRAA